MKRKQLLAGMGASAGMLILILDGKTALEGAQMGIELCLKTVIPSLFPFFILSILLTSSFAGAALTILHPLGQLCSIPRGAESILISGLLGGYPVGAQCISQAFQAGQLNRKDAERMLAFCNNAGPAFLFGMVASMFPQRWMAWALWGIHIASALLVSKAIPGNGGSIELSGKAEISLSSALNAAIRIMAAVCGWVILFRVIIAFLKRWILWILPTAAQVALTGLLELSNGCCELASITDIAHRFLICSGMLAFGGLCVTMQTISVAGGLSMRYYLLGKLLQTSLSLLLSAGIMYGKWQAICIICILLLLIPVKKEKKSSIRAAVGV